MRRSIATVSLSGRLQDKLNAIAAAGFDGIELFDADLVTSPLRPEEVAARCAGLGLGIDLFQPLRDIVGMRADVFPQRLRYARSRFEVVRRLGADRVLLCSAAHPDAVDDPDLLAEQLAVLGEAAAEYGITVAFEALAWGTYVNRVGAAWTAVERAARAGVGLAVDTFHLLASGDGARDLQDIPGERIAYLQVADAPVLGMDVLQWSRHHRCFPGEGSLDVVGVVAAVVEAGYRGPLSLEVFSDIVREAPARATAEDAMRSLLHLEERLRLRWADAPTRTQPPVELLDPPAGPSSVHASFVEIAADQAEAGIPELLASMGFRRDGEWWRAGQAAVALHHSPRPAPPRITSVGVGVDDPDRLSQRLAALGWPGSSSPVGTQLRWERREPADDEGWAIDHVGAAVDVDRSDAEVLFYRSVIGLRPGPVSEFIDPAGRLRSRVLLPESGDLRMVLNIVVRADGQVPTGVNQVAFRCPDLLGVVERMRSAAAPLVRPPDNYYEDLQARFDLEPVLLDRLRRLGVLYDRSGEGELLHAYTPLIGGRFYVEVLERRGGYDAFGAANTPVRLAAQAATVWPAR